VKRVDIHEITPGPRRATLDETSAAKPAHMAPAHAHRRASLIGCPHIHNPDRDTDRKSDVGHRVALMCDFDRVQRLEEPGNLIGNHQRAATHTCVVAHSREEEPEQQSGQMSRDHSVRPADERRGVAPLRIRAHSDLPDFASSWSGQPEQGHTMTQKLDDRWADRDLPVLVSVAKAVEANPGRVLQVKDVAGDTGLEWDAVLSALIALDGIYIVGKPVKSMGPTLDFIASGITERGRRAAGLWPDGETADALIDALRQAEEATDDPEEKTLIGRAAGALGSVSRDVITDVMTAVIRSQTGI
jgi:hypothetical protein